MAGDATMFRLTTLSLSVLTMLWLVPAAAAQEAPPGPAAPMKTIGGTKQQTVPSLIVLNAQGAGLAGNTLTLTGVAPSSIIFADRPVRAAGHALTAHLIDEWSKGQDSFANDPPNATVSVFDQAAGTVKDAVVVLRQPALQGDRLTFTVQVLEGDLAGANGPASVFIDIIGMPLTPFSFAGAARRTAYRGAFYAGAMAGAAYGYPPPPLYHPYYHPYYPVAAPYYRPYW
jgi:hypothetical protein